MSTDVVPKTDVIHAAGGLVWRRGARDREVAVVRRERYGSEWTLPKGKLRPGESWEDAAVREVREETGAIVERGPFAGGFVYRANGRPKVALFWHMVLVRETGLEVQEEVKAVEWLTPGAAEVRLTHVLLGAFAAGFSERLVLRALERFSAAADGRKAAAGDTR